MSKTLTTAKVNPYVMRRTPYGEVRIAPRVQLVGAAAAEAKANYIPDLVGKSSVTEARNHAAEMLRRYRATKQLSSRDRLVLLDARLTELGRGADEADYRRWMADVDEYRKTYKGRGAAIGAGVGAGAGALYAKRLGLSRGRVASMGALVGLPVGTAVGAAIGRRIDRRKQTPVDRQDERIAKAIFNQR